MDEQTLLKALLPLVFVNLVLVITALISLFKAQAVRGGKKWVWALVIILINMIGPILYFTIGKKEQN
ncbi:PLDc_N domain-containing protein [Cohnella pontilimi]|uniref:PLDc_N domain-containing protein n=1 Tax=Cohnella pontilimi TaxID=2564100 RepID=A0A4U0F2M5_9BACL|nr:PLD nuclease N-terminal domain-containing protein [Cohnella pontilimi]TJY38520.1 PLDc_N domain-containing protein [Cohnella pontilimi]